MTPTCPRPLWPPPLGRWLTLATLLLTATACADPLATLARQPALGQGPASRDGDDAGTDSSPDAATPDASPNTALPITVDDRCATPEVHIVEVLADPLGADGAGAGEFVELATTPRASLSDAELHVLDRSGEVREVIALLEPADGGGLLVVGGFEVPGARVFPRLALQQSGATLRLVGCDGETLDEVAWDSDAPGDAWPGEGVSLIRCPDGASWGAGFPTPSQAAQQPLEGECAGPAIPTVCDPAGAAGVRLNEVLTNPDGTDDPTTEFVELYVPAHASGTIELGLVDGADVDAEPRWLAMTLPTAAESSLLVWGATHRDASQGPLGIELQNGTDALVVRDCTGAVLDGLAWGGESGALADRLGVADGGPAASGQSLAWCDGAGAWATASPTPAGPNDAFLDPAACPGSCTPVTRRPVVIQEVLFDPPGADGTGALEFVELRGPAGASLEGWSLVGIDGVRGTTWLGPLWLDLRLNDDGLAVVGGTAVLSDLRLPSTLQNGPDGLALLGCDGTVGDAVAWGDPEGFAFAIGEGSAAMPPASGNSLARDAAGTDTGDNARDFSARPPSPGTHAE